MKSSIKKSLDKQVSLGINFLTVVAQAASKTKENTFSLGRKKPKVFTKKAYFAKSDGGLISAKDGGYKKSLDDSNYEYTLRVNTGGAGRLFTVVFDAKEKVVVILDVSNKVTPFSEVALMSVVHIKQQPEKGSVSRHALQKAYDEEHSTTVLEDAGLAEAPPVFSEKVSEENRLEMQNKVDSIYSKRSFTVNTNIYSQKAFDLGGIQGGIPLFKNCIETNNKTYY